jgi:hypothetical protein
VQLDRASDVIVLELPLYSQAPLCINALFLAFFLQGLGFSQRTEHLSLTRTLISLSPLAGSGAQIPFVRAAAIQVKTRRTLEVTENSHTAPHCTAGARKPRE